MGARLAYDEIAEQVRRWYPDACIQPLTGPDTGWAGAIRVDGIVLLPPVGRQDWLTPNLRGPCVTEVSHDTVRDAVQYIRKAKARQWPSHQDDHLPDEWPCWSDREGDDA